MPRRLRTALALALGATAAALPAGASVDCFTDAMVVFDGSGSMAEVGFDTGEATRIDEARRALHRAIPAIARLRRLGLIVYGGGPEGACAGVDLRLAPAAGAGPRILAEIDALRPQGLTPLTAAVVRAAEILDYRARPAEIVVVTDGNETCGGRPCATGAALAAAAADLTVHVIGYRVQVDFFAWDNPEQAEYGIAHPVTKCLADATGGTFVTTETVDELVAALHRTLGCAVIGAAPALGRPPRPSPATGAGTGAETQDAPEDRGAWENAGSPLRAPA